MVVHHAGDRVTAGTRRLDLVDELRRDRPRAQDQDLGYHVLRL
jgi:hypothetical protein